MGNTGLLRRKAEMTLLQPNLGETRRQGLRNLPFWHSSLFKSHLVKEGDDFLLKKGTSKDSQGFEPYQNKPFYCVNTCYPMDNMLYRSAQTGPPNVRKRRPVFPLAGRSSHCTRQVAYCTSFLSRQPDVIASFRLAHTLPARNILSCETFGIL